MGRYHQGSAIKYYVVIHGKCPGIYDSWEQVQFNIKNFPNSEYTSKHSKQAAIDLFLLKRQDWPQQSIPDFTIHASNRLTPIGKKISNDSLESISIDNNGASTRGRSSSLTGLERMSRKGGNSSGDLQIEVPTMSMPEKIILQQNWLNEARGTTPIPRSPSPGYFSPQNHRRNTKTPLCHTNSSSSLLVVPSREESEFERRESLGPDRSFIGLKSPAPIRKKSDGDFNLPAISAPTSLRRRAPSIELFPDVGGEANEQSSADEGDKSGRGKSRDSKERRDRREKKSKKKKVKSRRRRSE